jgi:undecaprenyl diphosphate synthase
LALSYGGREEIAEAARRLAMQVREGTLDPEDIDVESIAKNIPSIAVGEPDLIIRTGGEKRISNFLLFGLAYSELVFSDSLWPDYSADDFYDAIAQYQARERRFGRVGKGIGPANPTSQS